MEINRAIKSLALYAEREKLAEREDFHYIINQICQVLEHDSFEDCYIDEIAPIEEILSSMLDYAVDKGICENSVVYRDLFDTKIMGVITPRPSEVIREFNKHYANSPQEATSYYYNLSKKTDYIREYRIKNDVKWITKTEYGDIDITINLSKPEKDPKAIAAALRMKQSAYPKCQLCRENEGYAGRVNHPARENHRIIPIVLNENNFFLQMCGHVSSRS